MKTTVCTLAALCCIVKACHATEFFVSPSQGSDANTGTAASTPFKTLQKAADSTHPGDTVYAMSGVYIDTADSNVLNVKTSGTPDKPITFAAFKSETPLVQLSTANWSGINVSAGTQYIVIKGFEVVGINQSITWAGANAARQSGLGLPHYNGAGIACSGSYDSATKIVTPVAHVTVEDCRIHDCAEEGIGTGHSDYLMFRNNTIWNCSWYSSYNGSGISTWENADSNSNTTGYKIVIQGNRVYNCAAYVGGPGALEWSITDGNGIIIDDADCTQSSGVAYKGKVLVSNNLVYDCGGRGINVYNSNNVNVINNTLYHNARSFSTGSVQIDAGGAAVAPFVADTGFTGGATDSPWTGAVDTSLVTNVTPAPQAAYQSERYGNSAGGFTYTVSVKPLCSYRIILHFTEDQWTVAGQRQFNVSINGIPWLTNYDIFAKAGAQHRAVAEKCTDTSDPNGHITIAFTPGNAGAPKVNAIEVLSDYYTPNADLTFASAATVSGPYHCYNNIICPSPGTAAISQWNLKPTNIVCDYNLYYDGPGTHQATPFTDNHALWSDPLFVGPGSGISANFHLKAGSPALKSGQSQDLHSPNRGAY